MGADGVGENDLVGLSEVGGITGTGELIEAVGVEDVAYCGQFGQRVAVEAGVNELEVVA